MRDLLVAKTKDERTGNYTTTQPTAFLDMTTGVELSGSRNRDAATSPQIAV